MALEDYKDIVGKLAGFVTFCQMFSGVFLCRDIYRKNSTENIPVLPFLGGLVLSVLFYQQALLINDPALNVVNVGGFVLNTCYLLFYFLWTEKNKKLEFYKNLCKGIILIISLLFYVQIEDPDKVEFRFGTITTILLMFLIASPLFSLGEVIKSRSTESLPFPMIVSGFVVSASWLLYGIIIKNYFVIFQNIMGTGLCLLQLLLFAIFPSESKKVKKT